MIDGYCSHNQKCVYWCIRRWDAEYFRTLHEYSEFKSDLLEVVFTEIESGCLRHKIMLHYTLDTVT